MQTEPLWGLERNYFYESPKHYGPGGTWSADFCQDPVQSPFLVLWTHHVPSEVSLKAEALVVGKDRIPTPF